MTIDLSGLGKIAATVSSAANVVGTVVPALKGVSGPVGNIANTVSEAIGRLSGSQPEKKLPDGINLAANQSASTLAKASSNNPSQDSSLATRPSSTGSQQTNASGKRLNPFDMLPKPPAMELKAPEGKKDSQSEVNFV